MFLGTMLTCHLKVFEVEIFASRFTEHISSQLVTRLIVSSKQSTF